MIYKIWTTLVTWILVLLMGVFIIATGVIPGMIIVFMYAASQEPDKWENRLKDEVADRERLERLSQQPKWRQKLLGF